MGDSVASRGWSLMRVKERRAGSDSKASLRANNRSDRVRLGLGSAIPRSTRNLVSVVV